MREQEDLKEKECKALDEQKAMQLSQAVDELKDIEDRQRESRKKWKVENCVNADIVKMLKGLGMLEELQSKINVCTLEPDLAVMNVEDFVETTIELTLDSGCCDHVLDIIDTPGYACVLGPSPGSRQKRNFIVGNGEKLPNNGQILVNMQTSDDVPIMSTFQVAAVSRPLMSVSKICDQGLQCIFEKHEATIRDASGKVVATFQRDGGLYTCTMKLKKPTTNGFVRPE